MSDVMTASLVLRLGGKIATLAAENAKLRAAVRDYANYCQGGEWHERGCPCARNAEAIALAGEGT